MTTNNSDLDEILGAFERWCTKGGFKNETLLTREQCKTALLAWRDKAVLEELENIAGQYGEFRDETLGKPIDLKAVSLYRIQHRIAQLTKEKQ